jgi:hypothetical protein
MFPTAPSVFIVVTILAGVVISTFGMSVLWGIFAATLVVTTGVAIHRSIPRKER